MFLYDVKCISDHLHIEGTKVSNKLILKNLKKLSDTFKGEIIIRIPVIPEFNDSIEEMQKIADFLKPLSIKEVELMPYHKMGEHKYEALNMKMAEFEVPDDNKIEQLQSLFKKL